MAGNVKPILEKIEPVFGNSFTIREFNKVELFNKPFWHFHPEYEIVYISNGKGKRHIGDHISFFGDGDLIFLGPNLPHFGFTEEVHEQHHEIVVQMREDFLGPDFLQKPELSKVQQLFERARQGISFSGETKHQVGKRLEKMLTLSGMERLLELLGVLHQLSRSGDYELLNAASFALEVGSKDQYRLESVYVFVEHNFQRSIPLEEIAAKVNMTVPAFCRYFKKLTRKTFTQFVNEFRIANACRLLSDDHLSISAVSFESGFNNISHFNKQFKNITGVSPRDYRNNLKKLVQ